MVNVASLGVEVQSLGIDQATTSLKGLSGASKEAEQAVENLEDASRDASAAAVQQSAAAETATRALQAQASATQLAQFNARNLSFQLVDIAQGLPLLFQAPVAGLQNIGFQLAQIGQIYAGQGGLSAALRDSVGQITRFAARFAPLVGTVAAAGVAFLGFRNEVSAAAGETVGFGETAVAVFQEVRDGVAAFLQPAIETLGPVFATVWEGVVTGTRATVNFIIAAFRTGFSAVSDLWKGLPRVIGEVAFDVADSALQGINSLISGSIEVINRFARLVRDRLGVDVGQLGQLSLGSIDNPFAGAGAGLGTDLASRARENFGRDFVGEFGADVAARIQANRAAREGTESLGADTTNAARGFRTLGSAVRDATSDLVNFGRQTTGGFLQTFVRGLREGQEAWQSFGTAANRVIDQILNRLLGTAGDRIFDAIFSIGSQLLAPGPTNILPPRFAGNFANGGMIPAGAFGNVAEAGTAEIVERPTRVVGPARVTPIMEGGGGLVVNVNGAPSVPQVSRRQQQGGPDIVDISFDGFAQNAEGGNLDPILTERFTTGRRVRQR